MFSKPSKRKFIANTLFIPPSKPESERKSCSEQEPCPLPGLVDGCPSPPPDPRYKKEAEPPTDPAQAGDGFVDITTLVEQVLDDRSFSELFLFDRKVQEQAALKLHKDISNLVLESSAALQEEERQKAADRSSGKRKPDKIFDESATFPGRDKQSSEFGKIINELKKLSSPPDPAPPSRKPKSPPPKPQKPQPSGPKSPGGSSKQQAQLSEASGGSQFRVPPPKQPQKVPSELARVPVGAVSTRSKSSSNKRSDLDGLRSAQRTPSCAEPPEPELPRRFKSVSFPSYTELFPQVEIKQRLRAREDSEEPAAAHPERDFDDPLDYLEILRLRESICRRKEEEVRREQVFYERTIETFLTSLVYELHPAEGRFNCYCGRPACARHYASYQDKSLHVLADLGVGSFVCALCGRFFLERSSLYNHACT